MANTMKISYACSATPKVELDKSEGLYQAMTVIHEDVRTSVGGGGEITSDDLSVSHWVNGTNTPLTSNTGSLGIDASTDILIIKNLGTLYGTSTEAAVTDTVLVQATGALTIAELLSGDAIILPRPATNILIASGDNHVDVEVTILGT